MEESFITVRDFCDKLQVSPSTVYRMIKDGTIPAIKFGRYWKIPRSVFGTYDVFPKGYQQITGGLKRIR